MKTSNIGIIIGIILIISAQLFFNKSQENLKAEMYVNGYKDGFSTALDTFKVIFDKASSQDTAAHSVIIFDESKKDTFFYTFTRKKKFYEFK